MLVSIHKRDKDIRPIWLDFVSLLMEYIEQKEAKDQTEHTIYKKEIGLEKVSIILLF